MSQPLPARGGFRRDQRSALLLELRAADLVTCMRGAPVARSGHAVTVTRTGRGRVIDSNGVYSTAIHSEPRIDLLDLDNDGIRETAAVVVERASYNRCLYSSTFANATWEKVNSPTVTDDVGFLGDLSLSRIADTSSSQVAAVQQAIVFVGDGTKTISLVVAPGIVQPASGSLVFLRDFTTSTDKALATFTWSVAGVPIVVTTTGTYLGAEQLANGRWRLSWSAASIIAANTNVAKIAPAQINTEIGDLVVGGVQCEDNPTSTSPVDTTTTALQRVLETLALAIDFRPIVPCTLYAKGIFSGPQGRSDPLIGIGTTDVTSDAQNGFGLYRGATTDIAARVITGGSHSEATLALGGAGVHDVLVQLTPTTLAIAVDGGAFVTTSGIVGPLAAFSGSSVTLAGANSARWIELKLAAGLLGWSDVRTAA